MFSIRNSHVKFTQQSSNSKLIPPPQHTLLGFLDVYKVSVGFFFFVNEKKVIYVLEKKEVFKQLGSQIELCQSPSLFVIIH